MFVFSHLPEVSEKGQSNTSVGAIVCFLRSAAYLNVLCLLSPSNKDNTFLPFFRKGKKYHVDPVNPV